MTRRELLQNIGRGLGALCLVPIAQRLPKREPLIAKCALPEGSGQILTVSQDKPTWVQLSQIQNLSNYGHVKMPQIVREGTQIHFE